MGGEYTYNKIPKYPKIATTKKKPVWMLVGTHFLHRGCVTCVRIHAHSDVLLRGCTQAASLVSRGLGAPRSRAPPFLTPRPVPTPVHGHAADLPTCEPRGHDTRSATCDRGGGGQGERRGTGEPGGGGNARRRSRQSVRMGMNLRSRRGGWGVARCRGPGGALRRAMVPARGLSPRGYTAGATHSGLRSHVRPPG